MLGQDGLDCSMAVTVQAGDRGKSWLKQGETFPAVC